MRLHITNQLFAVAIASSAVAAAGLSDRVGGPSSRLLERMNDSPAYSYNVSECVGYTVSKTTETVNGILADLTLAKSCTAFGTDIAQLVLNVTYDTQERLHVHVYDKAEEQWQVPDWLIPRPSDPAVASLKTNSDLVFNYTSNPFEWWVTRRKSGDILFDTRASSLPAPFLDVIPANDLGEAGFVDSLDYHNNTAMPAWPFIFENQYIQVASALPKDANIYGLGDAVASSGFRRNNTATVQPGWSADRGDLADSNIYGNFPFYLEHRIDGDSSLSHGVFLMSSAGMDIILREGVIEYRLVGGTLDLTFFSGPSPTAVVQQYGDISGHSQLPPLFALGFNLCRWGYKNVSMTREVVTRMRDANIPLEIMWNDIDWMDNFRDFVPSPNRFDPTEYGDFVKELNSNHQHYTMIIDGAINLETNATDRYDPYRSGVEQDVFMKASPRLEEAHNTLLIRKLEQNPDGSDYVGQVWPGATVFPDWFAGNTQAWWTEAFTNLSKIINFSGVWLDMNEPSSFCVGSCFSGPDANLSSVLPGGDPGTPLTDWPEGYSYNISGTSGNITVNGTLTYMQTATEPALSRRDMLKRAVGSSGGKIDYTGQSELSESDINFPPYMLHNAKSGTNLAVGTVAPNATHANGAVELDVHNLWGFMEEKATHAAVLAAQPGKRPYFISRSTFTSAGRYTGAWGGDNSATWEEAKRSIQVILNFQMYHISLIGVDACGFNGNTDEALQPLDAARAFSPFFRNHNTRGAISQEPYIWDSVAEASRKALAAPYVLLPYWYTQFAGSYFSGTPVVNALFFEFPTDASLLAVSTQYFVGSSILVTPVLEPNVSTVSGLFPDGANTIWRDWWTHEVLDTSNVSPGSSAANVTVPAPLGHIPIHIRGGSILLLYNKAKYTTAETKATGFSLLASLSKNGTATGKGYQDDGASYPVQTDGDWFDFSASEGTLTSTAGSGAQQVGEHLKLITVLGVASKPAEVKWNGVAVGTFTYDAEIERFSVPLDEDFNNGFQLSWS